MFRTAPTQTTLPAVSAANSVLLAPVVTTAGASNCSASKLPNQTLSHSMSVVGESVNSPECQIPSPIPAAVSLLQDRPGNEVNTPQATSFMKSPLSETHEATSAIPTIEPIPHAQISTPKLPKPSFEELKAGPSVNTSKWDDDDDDIVTPPVSPPTASSHIPIVSSSTDPIKRNVRMSRRIIFSPEFPSSSDDLDFKVTGSSRKKRKSLQSKRKKPVLKVCDVIFYY